MARRGALISLGAGRYAIPVIGSPLADFKAWQPMLHARLEPHGRYYLAGLSALIEHRLVDISEPTVFVIVGFGHGELQRGQVAIAGRQVRSAQTQRAVFSEELGIETVRLSRSEIYRRSNWIRTLVDCLWHPELFADPETWLTAWGRASVTEQDASVACAYALALGPSVARRTGVMLEIIGQGDVARSTLPKAVRRSDRVASLVARGPRVHQPEIDPFWRVSFNIPRERVEAWMSYGK
jgi:predicted transcriptional regulator of viral defense system